ncbi:hypothetical protein Cgig2_010426 [Carnegiea gigantea]|uniref:Uncharacterized protein n=1 Tax=Carnegiea gigantea TaxID=171969 RepID=A0A9Q1QBN2_9CARY|nr:hypothetical protein Cgig2_010426 [Carnegiea gigantea]
MEAVNSARPLPHPNYVPTTACEPSHRLTHIPSPYHTERDREVLQWNRNGRPKWGTMIGSLQSLPGLVAALTRASRPSPPLLQHPMQLAPGELPEGPTLPSWLPSPGVMRREVNPTGMIHLLLRFGDKLKARNLEVDFLVSTSPRPTTSSWDALPSTR